jgi:hypothetical protein
MNNPARKLNKLEETLIQRDGYTLQEAAKCIARARKTLLANIAEPEIDVRVCEDYFGLEPDYVIYLL